MSVTLSMPELQEITASAYAAEQHSVVTGINYLVVDVRNAAAANSVPCYWPNCVVIGLGQTTDATDVSVTDEQQLDELLNAIDAQPEAAATLVQLLRHNAESSIQQGLFAESLAYSMLQQSRGFQHWLATADKPAHRTDRESPLLIERNESSAGVELTLILNRPKAHNAYSAGLRDALCEALHLAHADPKVQQVTLLGNGPSFSAGGDLSEFGAVQDAAEAHASRTTRSAGQLLATLACRTTAHLHGACIGAGIELPAFADQVSAKPDTFFQLPEVGMGLVPGAGGTVSICKRIGRQRTAWMALSGARIDTRSALQWGLIDTIEA